MNPQGNGFTARPQPGVVPKSPLVKAMEFSPKGSFEALAGLHKAIDDNKQGAFRWKDK